ncbi:copper resistance protein CopC [Cryobacterium adonitolivorans]|uniref:Copper resistance protein CopC n=1 Tax=Cryobacterium adonitolivorans TaxID=1259189 RepID=A0A4R8WGS8_9MICO|nr:copper resistance CopC family protein [Cryobacterium adonitolivorans]TFC07210.1 copper resistance protein CopC [Cryobacterium adonitolivorans]
MAPLHDSRRPARTRILKGAALAGVVCALATLGASAAPAFAHNSVLSTSPEAGSVVTEQPGVITITTNDNLLNLSGEGESSAAMQVSGPVNTPRFFGDGCTTVSGPSLEAEVQLGQPGSYTVVWQTVSTDGHSISDSFTFTWQPDATQVLAEGSAAAPECATSGSAAPAPAETDAAGTDAAESDVRGTDLLWIGGALVAVLAAIGVTLLVLRRPTPK